MTDDLPGWYRRSQHLVLGPLLGIRFLARDNESTPSRPDLGGRPRVRTSAVTVRHRWNMPEDRDPPEPGQVIVGARKAWRVVAVVPIESPIHPNAFRGTLQPIDWKPGDPWDLWYPAGEARTRKEPPM